MKKKGPVQTLREGSTSIPIYRTSTRTGDTFVAVWYEGSDRRRRSFAQLQEAVDFARKRAKELSRLGTASFTLTGEELLAYHRAKAALAELRIPVDTAVVEYVQAKRILGDAALVPAVQEYARLRPSTVNAPPVREVIEEFLASKASVGRSASHLHDLRWRLKQFGEAFSVPISDVRVGDVERWLASRPVKGRTKNNSLAAITNLVRFAERRGYVMRGMIDLSRIDRAEESSEIAIFSPEELIRLLRAARPEMVPYLAVCAFAGLRNAEASRLDWSEIGETHIDVKAAKAKTRSRRLVPVLDPLPQWLAPHRKDRGPICPFENTENQLARIAADAGVPWKRNGLRHSFGTYRMALVKNEQQVALEMGNTPGMVFRHYRAIAREASAVEWFDERR